MDFTGPGLFGIQSIDYAALLPVLLVAAGALAVLVADLFLTEERKRWLAWTTIGVLVAALITEAVLWATRAATSTSAGTGVGAGTGGVIPRNTFCMPSSAPGGGACSYSVDNFTLTLQTLVLAATVLVVLMSPRRFKVPFGEYHFLVLCSLTGAMVLAAARDFITITVALETLSLPAFALVGFGRRSGGEAALKFFLMSIASTAVMLFGISLIYGVTSTVFFDQTSASLARVQAQGGPQAAVAVTGIVLTIVGFAFKISAVPFHFWTPEVYAGAPIPVAAYLSVVSKAAGFAGLILTVEHAFRTYVHSIGVLIAVLAAVTMTVGNVVALRQSSAVRLLAWSTVAQAGYVLVPLAVTRGDTNPVAASVAYLVLYGVMNLGAFGVVSALSADPSTYPASAPAQPSTQPPAATHPSAIASGQPSGVPIPTLTRAPGAPVLMSPSGGELSTYRGMYREHPRSAVALAFFLLCLAGLPPGVMGLFAKVVVFKAAMGGDLVWLAVIMAINVVIGLYYYLRWAAVLFDVSLFGASLAGAPLSSASLHSALPSAALSNTAPPHAAPPHAAPPHAALPNAALPNTALPDPAAPNTTVLTDPDGGLVPAPPRAVPALAQRIAIGIAFALAVVFSFWPNPALDAITFR